MKRYFPFILLVTIFGVTQLYALDLYVRPLLSECAHVTTRPFTPEEKLSQFKEKNSSHTESVIVFLDLSRSAETWMRPGALVDILYIKNEKTEALIKGAFPVQSHKYECKGSTTTQWATEFLVAAEGAKKYYALEPDKEVVFIFTLTSDLAGSEGEKTPMSNKERACIVVDGREHCLKKTPNT